MPYSRLKVAKIITLIMFLSSCKTTPPDSSTKIDGSFTEVPEKYKEFFKPVGKWTGRLILPTLDERRQDGGVWILLENAETKNLIGKKFWLTFKRSSNNLEWMDKVRKDVKFSNEAIENMAKGLVLGSRVNGWSNVSLLESLAGARANNDMTVLLKKPVLKDQTLLIERVPVEVKGSLKALVRFGSALSNNEREVKFFTPRKGFTGPTGIVKIDEKNPTELEPGKHVYQSTTVNIEKSPFNDDGWFVYGRWSNESFKVEALEPRSLLMMTPDNSVYGKTPAKRFLDFEYYLQLMPQQTRRTLVNTRSGEVDSSSRSLFQYGEKGLLTHVFGWRSHPDEEATGVVKGNITGHFAFGFYEIVLEEITGELRADIEYHQVYAHNKQGVVSGAQKWHTYNGSLKRGWMYSIPIFDALISSELFNEYQIDDWKFNPLNELEKNFSQMNARYRIGGGEGISIVKPWSSCVQDSHNALYAALRGFFKLISENSKLNSWMSNNPNDPNVIRFKSLQNYAKNIERRITFMGIAQRDWRINAENPAGHRKASKIGGALSSLLSWKTSYPRSGFDNFLKSSIDSNIDGLWLLRNSMIGGYQNSETKPLAPSSPF